MFEKLRKQRNELNQNKNKDVEMSIQKPIEIDFLDKFNDMDVEIHLSMDQKKTFETFDNNQ